MVAFNRMVSMKGCISFSLYGNAAKYSFGMVKNVELAKVVYHGWTVVVHAERGHYAIPRLRELGAEVIEMDPLPGSGGMFWRFLPIDWADRFTHVIVRDADSRLNPRDRACTDAWIESGKSLHVIRDNDWHERKLIIGGAWGMKTGTEFKMAEAINSWPHSYQYGDDEDFLGQQLFYRFYPGDFIRHVHRITSPDDTPIPEHLPYGGFVCEQIKPEFDRPFKAYVLSPKKYEDRRSQFFASLAKNGGFLKGKVEWWKGTTADDRVIPSYYPHQDLPHYYYASMDHIDIIEESILEKDELLFVFEDDAVFTEDFEEFFLRMWVAIPPGWKAAMLGGQPWTDYARRHVEPPFPEALASVHGCLGMHATMWSRSGLMRGYDHFTYWNKMTIDQAFKGLQGDEPGFYAPAKWIVDINPDAIQFGKDH